MTNEKLVSMFMELIRDWDALMYNDYENTMTVYTDKGSMPITSFKTKEELQQICDEQKDKAFPLFNEEEKKMYLNTIDIQAREYWGINPKSDHPSSLTLLAHMPIQILEHHRMVLFCQLMELNTMISMKNKFERSETPTVQSEKDEDDWS